MNKERKQFMKLLKQLAWALPLFLIAATKAVASEADLAIPDLQEHGKFIIGGYTITAGDLLFYGSFVILGTLGISLYQLWEIYKQPAHKSMLDVAAIIFETCKTYLIQQGKFLLMLFAIIAVAMTYYFLAPQGGKSIHGHLRARLLHRRHGGLVRGGVVRHPRQHLRQRRALRSRRSRGTRGTSSTSRCEPACRSACS